MENILNCGVPRTVNTICDLVDKGIPIRVDLIKSITINGKVIFDKGFFHIKGCCIMV